MSMYNLLHGRNPYALAILQAIDLTPDEVGRFRDAFVCDGEIVVYTRNCGGNRECWNESDESANSERCGCPGCTIEHTLPKHPLYLRDADDDFDSTYASIYFKLPERYAPILKVLDTGQPWKPDAMWAETLEKVRSGEIPPPPEIVKLMGDIKKHLEGQAGGGGSS